MKIPFTGTCQCSQVHYEVTEEPLVTVACHCRECQKLSASAFSLTMVMKKEALNLLRGEMKMFERPADLGGTALCYFCPGCGNRIYHEKPTLPGLIRLKPGGLDDTSTIKPQAHVWTSRAQPWFKFDDGLPTFEKQPDMSELLGDAGIALLNRIRSQA